MGLHPLRWKVPRHNLILSVDIRPVSSFWDFAALSNLSWKIYINIFSTSGHNVIFQAYLNPECRGCWQELVYQFFGNSGINH